MSDEPIRVLLVDDHELIRSGLSGVFELEDDMTDRRRRRHRRRGAHGVRRARARRRRRRPAAAGRHRARHRPRDPQAQQRHRARGAHDARRRRADLRRHGGGRVGLRRQGRAVLGEVVRAARHAAVSPRSFVCSRLGPAMMRRSAAASTRLSDREHEVLLLLADGLGASAIGEQLYMSESTAKSHIARIYQKLGRQQPRPGAGHRDADRAALERAAYRPLSCRAMAIRCSAVGWLPNQNCDHAGGVGSASDAQRQLLLHARRTPPGRGWPRARRRPPGSRSAG